MGTAALVRCHRLFPPESTEAELVTTMVTARVMVVHHPFFLERRANRRLGWMVTATPMVVPPPPCPVP
jgi:hypothetical protein